MRTAETSFLARLFDAMLAPALPRNCLPANLPPAPKGRTIVVGAGKASAAMAQTFEQHWAGELSGLVVTRYGYAAPCSRIEIVEAGHPNPDEVGLKAAEGMLGRVRGLTADDLVAALISGGGSALLPCPAEGLTLEDEKRVNRALLASGASIGEINCLRKHISRIKGGRLALAAHPAKVVSLIISDIPDDDASAVASGPTLGDPTTIEDALRVVERYKLDIPARVLEHLRSGRDETPKPDDPRLANTEWRIVARARDGLEAAAAAARAESIEPIVLWDDCEGDARALARKHAALAMRYADSKRRCVLLSGGETTVEVRNKNGKGGRNSEYALQLAISLEGRAGIWALAADTDGIDGTEDNAGAFVTPETLRRAPGLNPADRLDRNDSYTFIAAAGGLFVTGPTLTNINDFRAILIL